MLRTSRIVLFSTLCAAVGVATLFGGGTRAAAADDPRLTRLRGGGFYECEPASESCTDGIGHSNCSQTTYSCGKACPTGKDCVMPGFACDQDHPVRVCIIELNETCTAAEESCGTTPGMGQCPRLQMQSYNDPRCGSSNPTYVCTYGVCAGGAPKECKVRACGH